jgi:Rab5 GDP/GTP exchange factor
VAAEVPSSSKLTYLPGPFTPFQLGQEARNGQAPGTPGEGNGYGGQIQTPYKPRVRRGPSASGTISPSVSGGSAYSYSEDTPTRLPPPQTNQTLAIGPSEPLSPGLAPPIPPRLQSLTPALEAVNLSRTPTPNLDFAGMQAEIDAAHERAAEASHETLAQIFPALDADIIDMVLEANGGDLGRSIEALLEMSEG